MSLLILAWRMPTGFLHGAQIGVEVLKILQARKLKQREIADYDDPLPIKSENVQSTQPGNIDHSIDDYWRCKYLILGFISPYRSTILDTVGIKSIQINGL